MKKFEFKKNNFKNINLSKKSKKHLLTAAALITVLAVTASFVALVAIPSVKKAALNNAKDELFEMPFSFPLSGVITSENGQGGNNKNSLLYIKSAMQNNADCFEVDICFSEDGTAYIAESANEIDKNTMPLEYLISMLSDEEDSSSKRHSLNMHLRDAANLAAIDEIVENYNMQDYCFFTGVSISQADYVKSNCDISFYVDYEIDKSKNHDPEYIITVLSEIAEVGGIGINCSIDTFSSELESIFKENWMKISLTDVETEFEIINALKYSPNQIITSNTESAYKILTEWNANAPSSDYVKS